MTENGTLTFSDPDGYAAGFSDAHIKLTITGAGDFKARLTRLKLNDLEVYRCCESLPRIAYNSLPREQMFLSFPVGAVSVISDGFALRNGDMVLHGRGERTHQRSNGACQWGFDIAIARAIRELQQGIDRPGDRAAARKQNAPPCAGGGIEIPAPFCASLPPCGGRRTRIDRAP